VSLSKHKCSQILPPVLARHTLRSILPAFLECWHRPTPGHIDIMSFLKRHQHEDDQTDDETIDPDLRLRSVRTAASAIAESIKYEQRAEKRKMQRKKSRFFRNISQKKRPHTASSNHSSTTSPDSTHIPGARRNVYVNRPPLPADVDQDGEPWAVYVRNKVRTSSTCHHITSSRHITPNDLQNILSLHSFQRIYTSNFGGTHLFTSLHALHRQLTRVTSVANLYFLILVILSGI